MIDAELDIFILPTSEDKPECKHEELELLTSENVHTICYRCKKCGHLIFL